MKSDESYIQDIIRWLESRKTLLIAGHQRPDGDSLGSALALGLALPERGIECAVVSPDTVPYIYQSLPGAGRIKRCTTVSEHYDGVIVLECASLARTGLEGLEKLPSVNIDHHNSSATWADINWINPTASAVGEMVCLLLEALKIRITPDIAANLFAAIMTDTGSFQYSNTTADTFSIASRLLQYGASPAELARSIYMNQKESRLRLLSRVLGTLEIDKSGKIAVVSMSLADLEDACAEDEDTEGFVNYPLSLQDIEASAFFRQVDDRNFRISLRSKTKVDVSRVAAQFGGGGHVRAAGFSLNDISLPEAMELVISRLRVLL